MDLLGLLLLRCLGMFIDGCPGHIERDDCRFMIKHHEYVACS